MSRSVSRAFTLSELLVVVAILAIVAGGLVVSLGSARGPAQRDLARHELTRLRDALLRFEADTGWLPGEGPFDLAPVAGDLTPRHAQAEVLASLIQSRFGVGAAEVPRWFDSAANLWELVVNPLEGSGHPLETWDPDRRRGWRGPYLGMGGEGQVEAGFVNRRLDPYVSPVPNDETGNVGLYDLSARLAPAPAVADPFCYPCCSEPTANQLRWTPFLSPGEPLETQGSPFLLIVPVDPDQREQARLICLGPDRALDAAPASAAADDLVLYLYR